MLTNQRLGIGLMTQRWSKKFADRFSLTLSPHLSAWLDEAWWLDSGGSEFNQPVDPDSLLVAEPDAIWAGFMLPDSVPLLGNYYGDWLCGRVGENNQIAEIVYWYHGGGDWVPFGKNLCEAILFDALRTPSPSASYVTPPPRAPLSNRPLLNWSAKQLGVTPTDLHWLEATSKQGDQRSIYHWLLDRGFASQAVRLELILDALDWPLKKFAEPSLARKLSLPWEPDLIRWLFDSDQVPHSQRALVDSEIPFTGESTWSTQDWHTAEFHALEVIKERQDLGWAFDIAGWCAERRGETSQAIALYHQGLQTSVFTDQSIRMRTHWQADPSVKFSAGRLLQLRPQLSPQLQSDPYAQLLWANAPKNGRGEIREYWLQLAGDLLEAGAPEKAYEYFYRAGWDLGSHQLPIYRRILQGLIESARLADWPARLLVAQTHLDCLLKRAV